MKFTQILPRFVMWETEALMNESVNEISFSLTFSVMNMILFFQISFMCFETIKP